MKKVSTETYWENLSLSHKKSLIRCIENKLIPKGLELSLEPTVGDYDQEFIDNWYSDLKEFYFILMKDIVKFCGKTIEETQIKLKQNLDKGEYDAIQNTTQINEKAAMETLQQLKFKKYNYLKHNPKPAAKAIDFQEDNENCVQPSYAQVTARAPLKRPSFTNTNSKPSNKNIHAKIRSSSPYNRFCKQGISPSRKSSQTNEIKNEKYEKEITELQDEIKALKLSYIEKTVVKNSFYSVNLASTTYGGQNETVQLLTIINFIQYTMTTSYSEQLKTQLDFTDFSLTQLDK